MRNIERSLAMRHVLDGCSGVWNVERSSAMRQVLVDGCSGVRGVERSSAMRHALDGCSGVRNVERSSAIAGFFGHRRYPSAQVDRIVALAMGNKPSVDFCGYWQRGRAA